MPNFTTDDLLQFLYHESTPAKAAAIRLELAANWALQEKFNILRSAGELLNRITVKAPRKKAVDNILAYATQAQANIGAGV